MKCNVTICSYINKGFDGQMVGIEAQIRNGFPGFDIIGLPDSSIKESRERIKSAMRAAGFKIPQQRILVSLSPAGVPKAGSSLDLGLAVAIALAGSGKKNPDLEDIKVMIAGELRLDGKTGSAPYAYGAIDCARKAGCRYCIIPGENDYVHPDPDVLAADSFLTAFTHIRNIMNNPSSAVLKKPDETKPDGPVFSDILGLRFEKTALTYSAAGFHSLLLFGPPGTGKTLLCSRLNRLPGEHTREEQETLMRIYGCTGLELKNPEKAISITVPHDCSPARFSAAEGALAYGGVLILDELNKYSKSLIEAVKDTYDKGFTSNHFPASFIMAANMNPCACGGLGKEEKVCTCSALQIQNHWNRLGKAFIERFDIRIPVPEQNMLDLVNEEIHPDSYYKDMVLCAAERQRKRYYDTPEVRFNGRIRLFPSALGKLGREIELLRKMDEGKGGTRNMLGALALARTIADCCDREDVTEEDFRTAFSLRRYGTGDYFWRSVNFEQIKTAGQTDGQL